MTFNAPSKVVNELEGEACKILESTQSATGGTV
jgi:hypothetical protein